MNKLTVLVISFLIFSFHVEAKKPKPVPPQTLSQLKSSIEKVMKDEHMPGLMLTLVTRDSVLFSGGLGFADLEKKTPTHLNHLFRLGSITKNFNALAILKLVSEGKLKLSDELKKIAPEITFENAWESTNPVRVVNLLEHTAGFDDMHFNLVYNLTATDPKGLALVNVFDQSLVSRWRPGERFSYSNPGFIITGYLIEKFSGQRWDQYITEQILLPLGMARTNFKLRIDGNASYSRAYEYSKGMHKNIGFPVIYGGADGSLNSCAADMAKFLQFYLNNWKVGSFQFLGEATLTDMERSHSTLAAKAGLKVGYGLANYANNEAGKYLFHGHDGGIDGFVSAFAYNREIGVGYALSNNVGGSNEKIKELVTEYLCRHFAKLKTPTQVLDKKTIEPYLGSYAFGSPRNEILGFLERLLTVKKIYQEGDSLYTKELFEPAVALVQTAPLKFREPGQNAPTLVFTKNAEGEKVLMKEGAYFEHTNTFWAIFKIAIFCVSVLFLAVSVLAGLAFLLMAVFKNLSWRELPIRIMPTLAALSLIAGVFTFGNLINNLPQAASINASTLLLFVSTSLFGAFSVCGLWLLIKQFRSLSNPWIKGYLIATVLSACYLTGLLLVNSWIGMRIWAL